MIIMGNYRSKVGYVARHCVFAVSGAPKRKNANSIDYLPPQRPDGAISIFCWRLYARLHAHCQPGIGIYKAMQAGPPLGFALTGSFNRRLIRR